MANQAPVPPPPAPAPSAPEGNSASAISNLGKTLMIAFNLGLTLIVVGCIFFGYRYVQARNAQINALQRVFANHQWPETVKQAEALFAKYPETRQTYGDQLGMALQFIAEDQYKEALKLKPGDRKQAMTALLPGLEQARTLVALNENALFALYDCYNELGRMDQAKSVIDEAESRTDISAARFKSAKLLFERKQKQAAP